MGCPKCGADTAEGMAFCPSCGASLARADAREQTGAAPTRSSAKGQINFRMVVVSAALLLFVVALVIVFWPRHDEQTPPSLSEVTAWVQSHQVTGVEIVDDRTLIVNREGHDTQYRSTIAANYVGDFVKLLGESTGPGGSVIDVTISYSSGFNRTWIAVAAGAAIAVISGSVGYFIGRRRAS